MVKNLRSLACKFELDQSECKPSQVHASHVQTESNSVWPGLKITGRIFDRYKLTAQNCDKTDFVKLRWWTCIH